MNILNIIGFIGAGILFVFWSGGLIWHIVLEINKLKNKKEIK